MDYKNTNIFYSSLEDKFFKQERSGDYSAANGIVMPEDISSIETKVVLQEVLGLARPMYNLTKIVRTVAMDELVASITTATKLSGQQKVPPMKEATIERESYSEASFNLWKNVVHVVLEDSAQKKARHNLMQLHMEDAAGAMAYMKNYQIASVMEAGITEKVSGTVYADWGTRTTAPNNDTDPFQAIGASLNYIEAQGHKPDFIAMHPTLWRKFITNSYVKDLVIAGLASVSKDGGNFTLPGYPTINCVIDSVLTETPTASIGPIVGSSKATYLGQGPVEAAKYRDERAGYDAFIIRDYMEPKVVDDTALDMICT